MQPQCTLQIHAQGRWHDAASVLLLGDSAQGWRTPSYTGYAVEWAVEHAGRRDAWALASGFATGLEPLELRQWPGFLADLLPQGHGREELLRQLGLPEASEAVADWPLLLAGAGNPIGHLRVKEAADWLQARTGPRRGFTDAEVAERSSDFMDYLGRHGLFVAGSSGVQGEWPKVLLTRSASDGLLHLDHSLPDGEAAAHFIVKFGRGTNERLAAILRHEAPYMDIARHLGLRVHAPLVLRDRALFIPRFDRIAGDAAQGSGQGCGVVRLAQESIATLTGRAGFGAVPSHEEVCRQLARVCTDPAAEVAEYLRRDVANLALGNKDNHARNTAVQRGFDGRIALTPVFDFAPMYLHPDGIARRIRWAVGDDGAPDWRQVLDTVAAECALPRAPLAQALQDLASPLEAVARDGGGFGLEPEVHRFLQPTIAAQVQALQAL
ncbi:HipA domain-containing protein [Acidovorax sp. SUPP1855]|uniref:type II toxin-antitoxin system HipA family toxin n=1 Tax=Acidovorax sp. SUPP1855 TaxID=431774 RepID=UPI0023DE4784|nr:HipA domain-containing protein [Acidovorax sp. SUPP1855]GKS84486.1 HipA domain-containing protein [Acidovorax sp. SUPP1855]